LACAVTGTSARMASDTSESVLNRAGALETLQTCLAARYGGDCCEHDR